MATSHGVDDYLETIYFLAFPIAEYRPAPGSSQTIAPPARALPAGLARGSRRRAGGDRGAAAAVRPRARPARDDRPPRRARRRPAALVLRRGARARGDARAPRGGARRRPVPHRDRRR